MQPWAGRRATRCPPFKKSKADWETKLVCLESYFRGFETPFLKNIFFCFNGPNSVIAYCHCCDLKLTRLINPAEYKMKNWCLACKSHWTTLLWGEIRYLESSNHAHIYIYIFLRKGNVLHRGSCIHLILPSELNNYREHMQNAKIRG